MDYRDIRKALWQHDNNLTTLGFNLVTFELFFMSSALGIYFTSWVVFIATLITSSILYSASEIFKWFFIIYFSAIYSSIVWFIVLTVVVLLTDNLIIQLTIPSITTPFVFGISLFFHAMGREFIEDVDIFDKDIRF